jgi:hypothetical protein
MRRLAHPNDRLTAAHCLLHCRRQCRRLPGLAPLPTHRPPASSAPAPPTQADSSTLMSWNYQVWQKLSSWCCDCVPGSVRCPTGRISCCAACISEPGLQMEICLGVQLWAPADCSGKFPPAVTGACVVRLDLRCPAASVSCCCLCWASTVRPVRPKLASIATGCFQQVHLILCWHAVDELQHSSCCIAHA